MKKSWSRFEGFQKIAQIVKFTKNYNGSDRMKKSYSRDSDKPYQKNYTATKNRFNTHILALFRSNFIKATSASRSIYHYHAKSMVLNILSICSKSNIQNFFYSCIFDVQYTIVSDTSVTFFTSNLIRVEVKVTELISCFSVYRCHGNIDFCRIYIISNFNPIPISDVNFTRIRVREVCQTAN